MPIDRKKKAGNPNKVTKSVKPMKTERTHEENQERAYIAASRRSDRSLEARVESARRASEIHKKRTGRGFRITEQDVMNEEMYEEEEDDISARAFARGFALRNMYGGGADSRLNDFLSHQFYMGNLIQQQINERYAKTFPNAPQFPSNCVMSAPPPPQNSQPQNSQPQTPINNNNIQSMYAPLQATQYASFQQQQTLPQQFAAANAQYQQNKQMQNMNTQPNLMKPGMHSPGIQMPQIHDQQQQQQQQSMLRLPVSMSPGMMQNSPYGSPHHMKKMSPSTSGHVTPQPSPLPHTPTLDLGPLSASLPADVQQFLDPSYGFLDYSTMQTPMSFPAKPSAMSEKSGTQNQEPEQLRTPTNSTKSIDEGSTAHAFSPDVFSTPSDIAEKHHDVPHDGGLQFSTDFFAGPGGMASYEELNNFDQSIDWMQDWGHHQQLQQPAYMFP